MNSRVLVASAAAVALGIAAATTARVFPYRPVEFVGVLHASKAQPGRVALTPSVTKPEAEAGDKTGPVYHSVPGEAILTQYPQFARWGISPDMDYDAAYLPFALRVEDISRLSAPSQVSFIHVSSPKGMESFEVHGGMELSIDGDPFVVEGFRKWAGIAPREGAPPMVEFAAREGDAWREDLVLGDGEWVELGDDTLVMFAWHASEAKASAAIAQGRPGLEAARWGVEYTEQVHWMNSFVPGSQVEVGRGAVVTLLACEGAAGDAETPLSLRLAVTVDATSELVVCPANAPSPEVRLVDGLTIRFDYPGEAAYLCVLHAWKEDRGVASIHTGNETRTAEMAPGKPLMSGKGKTVVRVERVLPHAIHIDAESSRLYEVGLRGEQRKLYLCEGDERKLGDAFVQFELTEPEAVIRVTLSLISPDGSVLRRASLGPNGSVRHGDWRLALGEQNWRTPGTVVIEVSRLGPAWRARWAALAVTAALWGLWLVMVVRGMRRK